MRTTGMLTLALIVLLVLSSLATASVPPMINYQGKLMQPSGTPVPDGEYKMSFTIYGQPTEGTALWSEVNEHVHIKGGLYSVLLGSVINLPGNIFDAPDRFFGVKVGDDPEMMPRQQIASVGFAMRAASADIASTVPDAAITMQKIADASITGQKLANGSVAVSKIVDGSVTSPKIAAGAVTSDKIAAGAVTSDKIALGSILTTLIADRAITASKIENQPAWINVTFQNGWHDYEPAVWQRARYMKDSLGFVHIQGMVSGGTIQGGVPVFTLPPGYRPSKRLAFGVMCGYTAQAVLCDIAPSGELSFQNGYNDYVAIGAITFKAEQ